MCFCRKRVSAEKCVSADQVKWNSWMLGAYDVWSNLVKEVRGSNKNGKILVVANFAKGDPNQLLFPNKI